MNTLYRIPHLNWAVNNWLSETSHKFDWFTLFLLVYHHSMKPLNCDFNSLYLHFIQYTVYQISVLFYQLLTRIVFQKFEIKQDVKEVFIIAEPDFCAEHGLN